MKVYGSKLYIYTYVGRYGSIYERKMEDVAGKKRKRG